jgi:hypothetical protein
MLPVLILSRYSLRKESGDAALEWASGGECHALSFFDFRHCLTIFSLDSFAHLIRNWYGYTMVVVDLAKSLGRVVEKKEKNPAIFAISVVLRISTSIRSLNVGAFFHSIDCRGSTSITGGTQAIWEEDLCGCGCVKTDLGDKGSFSSFSTDFQFYFTKPPHACFRLWRASFDVALSGERLGVHGRAWERRIAFVEAFFVMLVRFLSWMLSPFPVVSIVSNPVLSLQLTSFNVASNWDAFEAFGWARKWRIDFVWSFLVGLVCCFVMVVASFFPLVDFL